MKKTSRKHVSTIKSLENNVTLSSHFLNNLDGIKEKGFSEEDSKFTDFDK